MKLKIGVLKEVDPIKTTERFEPLVHELDIEEDLEMIPPVETDPMTFFASMMTRGVFHKPKKPVAFEAKGDEAAELMGFYLQKGDTIDVREVEPKTVEPGAIVEIKPRMIFVDGDDEGGEKELMIP